MNKEEFIKELEKIEIYPSKDQLDQLEKYIDILKEYNKHTNITTITKTEDIYLKHFYDSLTITKAIKLENQKVLDIGSGGGFPGIVLKIIYPNLKMTLLDSNNKKTKFQQHVIKELKLKDITAINERAEIYEKKSPKYDIVVSRAVAHLNTLSELSIPYVQKNGYFISMKGELKNELEESKKAIELLGGKIENIINFTLPKENSQRTIIKIKKVNTTPSIYPRTYDKIIKKPIK